MDYLNPQNERSQAIRLIIGYVLVGIAVLIGTLVLLYQAYGFGLNKDGEVIQKGLVFVSSQPDQSQIYLDGTLNKAQTNSKLSLPAGQYKVQISRDGYDSWKRIITVDGGGVQHFDYPKLFPTQLKTTSVKAYASAPKLATQSPDRRWLLVAQPDNRLAFDQYDLADPKKVTTSSTPYTLAEGLLSGDDSATSFSLVEWSTDNRHLLLQHYYQKSGQTTALSSEYILLDRIDAAKSLNLTKSLSLSEGAQVTLRDKKYDQFYIFDQTAKTLGMTSLGDNGKITPLLDDVLAYKSYGSDIVLYASDKNAVAGRTTVVMRDNGQNYTIRDLPAAPTSVTSVTPYLLNLATYNGDWYVAAGTSPDNRVYVYKNPQQIRRASATAVLTPLRTLRINAPSQVAFSSNTQYIMIANGGVIADYDIENDKSYSFTATNQPDAAASNNLSWMDSARLTYVSGGKVSVIDYDNINAHQLSAANPAYLPFYDRNYETLYTLTTAGLTATSLLTPADL